MDVLSDAVTALRTGRPVATALSWRAPWGQRFAAVPGAVGIQVVVRGECWLIPEGAPIHLQAFDDGDSIRSRPGDGGDSIRSRPGNRGGAIGLWPGGDDGPIRSRPRDDDGPIRPWPGDGGDSIRSRPGNRGGAIGLRPGGDDGPIRPWPGGDDGPIRLRPGDVVLLTDGRGHALADDPSTPLRPCQNTTNREISDMSGPTLVLCAAYELNATHPLLRTVPGLVHLHAGATLQAVVDLLATELEAGSRADNLGVTALLDLLFLHTLRAWSAEAGEPDALTDPAVRAALDAIHARPEHPWTVAALAAEGGLSRAPFARRFTALTGQPPLSYLTWWRLTLAARLLRESDAPLRAVARRVGYASEFAFAAAFKRRYGTPPGRFRAA